MDEEIEMKPRWGRRLAIAAGVLAGLLVVLYFVATSAAFLKGVILPRVGKEMNATITVDDASLSPFSSVTLKNLRLQTTGSEPLLTAGEVRLRYGLIDIIKGRIDVGEATVEGASIHVVTEVDGSSNLDPLLSKEKVEKEPSTKKLELNVRNVALKNASVRMTRKLASGGPNVTEVTGLNVTLDRLVNGEPSKATIAGDLRLHNKPPGGSNDVLAAKISGGFDFSLSPEMAPATVKGQVRVQVAQAEGAYGDASGLAAILEADASPTALNQAALRFERNGQALGQLRVSGPFDMAKSEGVLTLEILALDRHVLNIAGAGAGLDFAGTTLSSTNKVEITRKATFLSIEGRIAGRQIGVIREQKPTPPIDLDFNYKVAADLTAQTAALEKILLTARHKNAEFLSAAVDRPLNLSWGEATYGLKDSSLRLAVTNLNLADWQGLIGTNAPIGVVNVGLNILAQDDGRKLGVDVAGLVSQLSLTVGSNRIDHTELAFRSKGTIENLKNINLSEYQVSLRSNMVQNLEIKGALRYDLEKNNFGVQIISDGLLPNLLAQFKVGGLSSTFGVVKFNANLTGTPLESQMSGFAQVDKFTGTVGDLALQDVQATLEYTIDLHEDIAQIHRTSLTINQGFNRGGAIDLNGRVDTKKMSGNATFKIVELNQFALSPVLQSSLGDKKLVSVSVNSSGTVAFSPGTNEVKVGLNVTNLLVQDPAGSLPKEPLGMGLNVDSSVRGDLVDIRQLSLQLTPTARADNQLQIEGRIDMATNKPAPSVLSIKSPGLDFTRYHEIFAGNSTNAAAAANPAVESPAAAVVAEEAPPVDLPIRQLTATLAIDRIYLKEVAVSNWVATLAISNQVVTLNPLSLGLNGAPVSGSLALNLGVPGYTYDVALKANQVPLEPFANSFATTNAGQYKGHLAADARIRGAGTLDASIQKNLQGQASLSVTNLDLQIVGPKLKRILTPIAIFLRVPELMQTPINWVDARVDVGGGKFNIQKMAVESEAFYADVTGEIVMDNVLTNSPLNLPVALSLRRSVAEKAHLVSNDTPADAKFARLPNFVTIKGTVGAPESDINKLAMAGLLARGVGGLVGNRVGGDIQSIGNLLTGNKAPSTNAPGTDAPAGLIQGLGGLLRGGGSPTNAPASTNAPAATNSPAQNFLNIFKKAK